MFKKCFVANRGEVAVRIIRACHELDIRTVTVYSDVDSSCLYTRLADEAYHIASGNPAESYLNIENLLAVAMKANADCVHPGYGFLSESAEFARAVIDAGLTWVGPNPDSIAVMGAKTEARRLMQSADVPLVPGFQSDSADDAALIAAATDIGYPVMVKASGGGGGKGIRIVYDADTLPDALASARREAINAFGDSRLFLEKYIDSARHIEVQIVGDIQGNILHLYERECSTQRRHQKIVEESPSPSLDPTTRNAICTAAINAARTVDYVNVGTVEFIVTQERKFYFLEMNTRLQVEHPVTELVIGIDLVQLQFLIAAGQPIPFTQADVVQQGHAIECRLYAEDPRSDFLPATGVVQTFLFAQGPGIRVDTGLSSGDAVTIHYDPMIAKLIAYARTRTDAIQRMRTILQETTLLGLMSNLDFLLALMHDDAFLCGELDTGYVDRHLPEIIAAIPEPGDKTLHLALVAAAFSETMGITEAANKGDFDTDQYSPWSRSDGFRLA